MAYKYARDSTRDRSQSRADGEMRRLYVAHCSFPSCRRTIRASQARTGLDKVTAKKARSYFRNQGWSERDVIGWTCGQHNGHERRQLKEGIDPGTSAYDPPEHA